MKIPFLDFGPHLRAHRKEFDRAIGAVLDSGAFAGGEFVERFESEFAAYCGTRHAVGVGNGTEALWMALLALGVGPGDEVITVPNTFIATAEAILFAGAVPVFVDIEESHYGMSPAALGKAITPRTKAIIPVHLFGQTVDMDAILDIARAYGIPVVEDAAQAQGSRCGGRRAGSMGTAGCFSFYPGKNLGAFGEAGAVVTDDDALAAKMRMFRDHGQPRKYVHEMVGWNCRMDGIQAAVLSVQLRYLDERNGRRRKLAAQYDDALRGHPGIVTPACKDGMEHIYHIYPVRVARRDEVLAAMAGAGIACGIHYPVPIHLQQACLNLGYGKGAFPVAERCAAEFLSLPLFPELTSAQVGEVSRTLLEILRSQAAPVPAGAFRSWSA